jgi:hypothetical protein
VLGLHPSKLGKPAECEERLLNEYQWLGPQALLDV